MSVTAYTLVRTKHHKPKEIADKIRKLQFVKEAIPVYGEYNIIVKTETESIRELNVLIYNQLRTIPGLTVTTTMITAKVDSQ